MESSPPKIALLINSCESFYQTTLPQFLHHAKETGIPFNHIYAVIGESSKEHPQLNQISPPLNANEHHLIYCPYINIDYNAAIFFSQTPQGREELQKYTHFFYIHDTADLLPCFWGKIQDYARNCQQYIKLSRTHTKNIGLFQTQWFLENKSKFLENIVNTDLQYKRDYKTGCFPNKEWLYQNIPRLCPWNLGEDCLFDYDEEEPIGDFFENEVQPFFAHYYGSKDQRRVSVYQEPGIVKYQKNWGQLGSEWNMSL